MFCFIWSGVDGEKRAQYWAGVCGMTSGCVGAGGFGHSKCAQTAQQCHNLGETTPATETLLGIRSC